LPKFTYTVVNRECMFCIKLPTAFAVPTGSTSYYYYGESVKKYYFTFCSLKNLSS
jgi:hypothetical protein